MDAQWWDEALRFATADAPRFAGEYLDMVLSSPRQILAHAAAVVGVAFVSVAAVVRTMVPLRWLAVGSNVGLLLYGALHPSPPTLAIAAALLPVNLWRAVEVMRLTRRVQRSAGAGDLTALWLRPYMKARRLRSGRVLFRQGDLADRLFLLVEGELQVVEIGQRIEPGRIFGEIALFSPAHRRTNTVRAASDCTVLSIHESTVRQLYYQNPDFGFHLISLLAERLGDDVARARQPAPAEAPADAPADAPPPGPVRRAAG